MSHVALPLFASATSTATTILVFTPVMGGASASHVPCGAASRRTSRPYRSPSPHGASNGALNCALVAAWGRCADTRGSRSRGARSCSGAAIAMHCTHRRRPSSPRPLQHPLQRRACRRLSSLHTAPPIVNPVRRSVPDAMRELAAIAARIQSVVPERSAFRRAERTADAVRARPQRRS